jgi:hypothetical protein
MIVSPGTSKDPVSSSTTYNIIKAGSCWSTGIHTLLANGGVLSCSMHDTILMPDIWFRKLVDMVFKSSEFFSSDFRRSARKFPINEDEDHIAAFAIFASKRGHRTASEPRCGVLKNMIPLVDSEI